VSADERLLTIDDVAERLQLSPLTVANMLRAGTVPGFKLGHLWRVRAADLDAFIVERAEAGKVRAQARRQGDEKGKP